MCTSYLRVCGLANSMSSADIPVTATRTKQTQCRRPWGVGPLEQPEPMRGLSQATARRVEADPADLSRGVGDRLSLEGAAQDRRQQAAAIGDVPRTSLAEPESYPRVTAGLVCRALRWLRAMQRPYLH
jgi:hypothetical protein